MHLLLEYLRGYFRNPQSSQAFAHILQVTRDDLSTLDSIYMYFDETVIDVDIIDNEEDNDFTKNLKSLGKTFDSQFQKNRKKF